MRRQTWSEEVDYRQERRHLYHLAALPRVRVPRDRGQQVLPGPGCSECQVQGSQPRTCFAATVISAMNTTQAWSPNASYPPDRGVMEAFAVELAARSSQELPRGVCFPTGCLDPKTTSQQVPPGPGCSEYQVQGTQPRTCRAPTVISATNTTQVWSSNASYPPDRGVMEASAFELAARSCQELPGASRQPAFAQTPSKRSTGSKW